jgi:pimeloyl-ACP methyl ester carboxylesterase
MTGAHQAVTLLGWSLGGLYARELARVAPARIRQVITLGTPSTNISDSTHFGWLYETLGKNPVTLDATLAKALSRPCLCPSHRSTAGRTALSHGKRAESRRKGWLRTSRPKAATSGWYGTQPLCGLLPIDWRGRIGGNGGGGAIEPAPSSAPNSSASASPGQPLSAACQASHFPYLGLSHGTI